MKFRGVLLQTERNFKSLKFEFFTRKCLKGGHILPACHTFLSVKIAIFELFSFLELEADLFKTSHFCYTQYGESTYGSCFSLHSKVPDILKRDVISKMGYSKYCPCLRILVPGPIRYVLHLVTFVFSADYME